MFQKDKSSHRIALRVSLLLVVSMFAAMPAFAGTDPGVNIGSWLTRNVGAVIPGILLCVGAYFMFVRDWVKMLSFFGMTLVLAMIMNWTSMQSLAGKFFTMIFG